MDCYHHAIFGVVQNGVVGTETIVVLAILTRWVNRDWRTSVGKGCIAGAEVEHAKVIGSVQHPRQDSLI